MASRFPFRAFPDGWFQVAYSDELNPGAARPARALGRELALFRARSGRAAVLDAFCPHLGAHLGEGGVDGEGLRCPFHAWRFGADGACDDAPGAKPPKGARVGSWRVAEVNGLVLVHHDRRGRPPSFEIPALPELSDGRWVEPVRRRWTARTHAQEPLENLVDAAHFEHLHASPSRPRVTLTTDGPRLSSRASVKMRRPGGRVVDGSIDWDAHGMGFGVVRLRAESEVLFVNAITPVDEEVTEVRMTFTWPKDADRAQAEKVVRDIERQVSEDIAIWEKKIYLENPLLVEGEAPILALRRWCRQFLD